MSEPEILPLPAPSVPPPAVVQVTSAAVVQVSAAQVWSSAAQNIIIGVIIGGLMFTGKVGSEIGLLALGAVSGIDLLGRFKAKTTPLAALALGATGMLGRLPHLLVALVVASTLFSGCGLLPSAAEPKDAKDGADLVRTTLDQAVYACELPVSKNGDISKVCSQILDARRALGERE